MRTNAQEARNAVTALTFVPVKLAANAAKAASYEEEISDLKAKNAELTAERNELLSRLETAEAEKKEEIKEEIIEEPVIEEPVEESIVEEPLTEEPVIEKPAIEEQKEECEDEIEPDTAPIEEASPAPFESAPSEKEKPAAKKIRTSFIRVPKGTDPETIRRMLKKKK